MQRKLFWLFIFILSIFLACLCTNYDYDFFDRIIVGERIFESGIFPYQDFLSYTPTHNWYDHEWGSGLVFYVILKYFGVFGILIFYAIMLWLTTFFTVKASGFQRHSFPKTLIFTVIFMVIFAHLNFSLVRCQLFSFFFFSLFLYILEKYRCKKTKLIWLIPFLTVIWNNLHGGVVAGLGLLAMYFVGEFLNRKKCGIYLGVLCCSLPLLIINPYGMKYLEFLFSATTMDRKYIIEWWSPFAFVHRKYFMFTCLFIVYGAVTKIFRFFRTRNFDYTNAIVILITLFEGFIHAKLLTFAVIAVSVFSLNEMCEMFVKYKKNLIPLEKSLYYVICILAFFIPLFSPTVARADITRFPLYETEFLRINDIKGNVLSYFAGSGYIAYKRYPDNLIYMDGRYEEVYNDKEYNALKDFYLGEKNWKDAVENYGSEILMPTKESPVYQILMNDKDWVNVFNGNLCGIFVRKNTLKIEYKEPSYDIEYYRNTMFDSVYFGKKLKRMKK